MIKIKGLIHVTMRQDGKRVLLLENDGLLNQVLSNRRVRKLLGGKASNVLMIDILLDGEPCRVDSSLLLVRSFYPESRVERSGIRLAEQLVMNSVQFRLSDPPFSADGLTVANELLWLTWTGHMYDDRDRSAALFSRLLPPFPEIRGTWNTYEPELW